MGTAKEHAVMTAGNWAILGAAGMLGQEFMKSISDRSISGFDRTKFDITNIDSVREVISGFDVVINCAAYTAVDDAEQNEQAALAINGTGSANVAIACAEFGSTLVHMSTDYVFSGDEDSPYLESSAASPQSAYGRTKLAGESAVQKFLPNNHYLVRTAWLYGQYGPNFVKTMIDLEKIKDVISVVDDQVGQPTWTLDLVNQIVNLVDSGAPAGTFHGTSSGHTSWFGLTKKIYELIGADPNRVTPTTTEKFPRPAKRPAYSVLGHTNWQANGMEPIRAWDQAIEAAFAKGSFNAS